MAVVYILVRLYSIDQKVFWFFSSLVIVRISFGNREILCNMNIVESHNKVNVEYQNTVTHSIECRSNKSEFQRND